MKKEESKYQITGNKKKDMKTLDIVIKKSLDAIKAMPENMTKEELKEFNKKTKEHSRFVTAFNKEYKKLIAKGKYQMDKEFNQLIGR